MYSTRVAASSAITTPMYLDEFSKSQGRAMLDGYFNFQIVLITITRSPIHLQVCKSIFLFYSLLVFMSVPQDYEKLILQIQSLKKVLTAQKLAHQSTIAQLQQSYNLNLELQQVIKSQGSTITNLNKQLTEKTNKLAQISQSYEIQLMELKQFVHAKERELQGIRGALVVTDYDMIRLRVVGELELVHKEQMQEVLKEKERIEKLMGDQKQARLTMAEKLEHIKKQLQRRAEQYEEQKEQNERKHMREINKVHQKLDLSIRTKKDLEKSLETLQKRYQTLQQKYQSEINKAYGQIKSVLPHNYDHHSSASNKASINTKYQTDIHQKNMEIDSLNRKIEKEKVKYQQNIKDLERKLKDAKQNAINWDQHTKKANDKQKQHDQMAKGYQKKIRTLKQDHQEELRRVRKEHEDRIEDLREKHRAQKQNSVRNSNVQSIQYSPYFGLDKKQQSPQKDRQIQQLTQQIKSLEKQNQRLRKQHNTSSPTLNKTSNIKTQRISKTDASTQVYKTKLKQANQQIMNLLLQKVTMKQQLSQH